MPPDRRFVIIGAALALVGVAAGAFGAHALRSIVPPGGLETFETGARYQMYHGLALLTVGLITTRWPARQIVWGGWLLFAGTIVFSGTLYTLTLTGARWWGAITPIGGVMLLLGWSCLIWGLARSE